MGYQNDGRSGLFLQLLQKIQDLGLNGHIQGGGRFVGNENGGVAGQSHGDHHPLAHTAGKLVGVGIDVFLRIRDAHHLQHPKGFLPCLLLIKAPVEPQPLHDLFAHGHGGVQTGHWILKDHADLVAPQALEPLFIHVQHVFPVKEDGAVLFDLRKGRFPQAHDGLGRGGLAAAGFPYKGQGLALVHVEGHPPNGLDLPRIGVEGDLQIFYIQYSVFIFHNWPHFLPLGSMASLRPSPIRVKQSMVRAIISTGNSSR